MKSGVAEESTAVGRELSDQAQMMKKLDYTFPEKIKECK